MYLGGEIFLLIEHSIPLSKEQLFSWLKNVGEQYSTGVVIIDPNKKCLPIIYYNAAFAKLSGYTNQQLIGKSLSVLNGIKTDSEIENELNYHLLHTISNQFKILQYALDGTAFWNNITLHHMRDTQGVVQYTLITCDDITEMMLNKMLSKLEREVYIELEQDDELQTILQLITEQIEKHYIRDVYCAIHLVQPDGAIKAVATGSLPHSFVKELQPIEMSAQSGGSKTAIYMKDLDAVTYSQGQGANELNEEIMKFHISTCWSKPILNQQQKVLGSFTLYFHEKVALKQTDIAFLNRLIPLISLSIKYGEQKQQLSRLAYYDVETNIPNTHYFHNKLTKWIDEGHEGIIIIIQPGEYSNIVDLYGRKAGEEVIRQIVDRLNQHAGDHEEFIARFSTSAVIVASKYKLTELDAYDSRVSKLTITPYFIGDKELYITLKIGVGFFGTGQSADNCVRQADIALSKSRATSGTKVSFFEEDIDTKLQQEMDTLNQLSYGLQHDEFTFFLQPKMNLQTAQIEGFEALSRWNSHVLGSVSPAVFIPIAEQAGKIRDIDKKVINGVLNMQRQRLSNGLKTLPIAVNISPDHFYHESFVQDFLSLLRKYDVPPQFIKLEVTESIELVDFLKAKDILSQLKEAGIESSIDDFGVGYSSLSYLPKLPFAEIKIDRSFINAMDDSGMIAVVQTIVQLASNLKMRSVAEGIETFEQFNMLKAMGCHTGQGYYFYKPIPIEEATKLLDAIE